ncbi:dephospho-CoA kinase [Hoeflea prorocentri]|uniref:Dephospho-CoA kinase n=1 Tax=Hoeflea prorocentri TaxID=1922333 RepID=A0A9X3UQ56_9HYPH|nr:dephospho-CoA kinase [Hoeflea prorocentri]MCY6383166.1 dephospho-CoA kinase [Hoeflea prorocentri]MDA5400966.1 dephospho-CoA kinase [Hoeflea prorocentri]
MMVLGLTGSIGMGKSTAADMFAERGIPVISADQIVHDLYAGEAAPLIEAQFPGTVQDNVVDRQRLSAAVLNNEAAFKKLESIVHPLVEKNRAQFVDRQRQAGAPLVVLDIPLLFEGKGEQAVDKVVVVSCAPDMQRERVLRRPGMTEEKFEAILARQVPDEEKRARADFVIDTSGPFDETREQINALVDRLIGEESGNA